MNRDNIKRKIKALLAKTTENGASESEAISAMNKAQQLMLEHFISENEIIDPFIKEKCVFKSVDLVKSGYDLSLFYCFLSKLFDCEHYYTRTKITFFGFEDDVDLCIYFYYFISKSCLKEKDKFIKSDEFKKLRKHCHGRTLAASFIDGFISSVSLKIDAMYFSRERNMKKEVGLMVIEKQQRVKEQFQEFNLSIRTVASKQRDNECNAFLSGLDEGNNLSITQGIGKCAEEKILMLE